MERRILINNTVEYSLDRVSCFERTIANQLNYRNGYYGDLFIALSKMYQFYFLQNNQNIRKEVFRLSKDILNVKIINIKRKNIRKYMSESSNSKCLPIVGVDLIDLFYSNYYKEKDWPHWFLITGYDEYRKIFFFMMI